jgi:predicted site-specific integrase-resolvase
MKILKIDRKKEFQFKRLRVAAYTRVSSDKETMLHSLAAQVSYYSSLIQRTPTWEYKGVYADEGITGTKANRPEFKRLLSDCLAGKIDMIITKSVSRFARNTVTLLSAVRKLKELNIDIYFEEQNIHTKSSEGELLLTLLASVAQEESKEGIPTLMGKLWTEHGIDYILRNEKYTGELLLQKEYVADHLSKKKLPNNGVYPMYSVEDNHPSIIDMAIFKAVQELLNKPQTKITRKTYPYTGMLICGSCGKHYIRKKTHKGYTWTCGLTERFDKDACPESKNVPEDILLEVTAKALGLQVFNAEIFAKKVAYITARAPNILEFHFKDNKEKILTWEHKSRKDSWTEEMKVIAKETGRKGGLTRWKRK